VAKEKGFELVDTSPGDGETTYCYQHPETEVGLLISTRKNTLTGRYEYDWSIHEPETFKVIASAWSQEDGTSFLKKLIQLQADPDSPTDSSEDSVEDSEPKAVCKSCKALRVLDLNGFCYLC